MEPLEFPPVFAETETLFTTFAAAAKTTVFIKRSTAAVPIVRTIRFAGIILIFMFWRTAPP